MDKAGKKAAEAMEEAVRGLATTMVRDIRDLRIKYGVEITDTILRYLDEELIGKNGYFDATMQTGWRIAVPPKFRSVEIGGKVLVRVIPAEVVPKGRK
jgi:hypothetical protein